MGGAVFSLCCLTNNHHETMVRQLLFRHESAKGTVYVQFRYGALFHESLYAE